MFDTMSIALAS